MRKRAPKTRPKAGTPLTRREEDAMRHICEGFAGPKIAELMGIGICTAEGYIKSALARLGAKTRAEAAYRVGLRNHFGEGLGDDLDVASEVHVRERTGAVVTVTKASQVRATITGPNSVFNQG